MAKHCINIGSPEFKKLVEETNSDPLELAANISLWQDSNNTDEFPSVNQVKKFGEVLYQKQTASNEGIIAAEKTIRDLAARMADRIGMKVKFESDRTKDYKGKIENNTAVINLANATLDTPIHEILGHPIIRTIKTGKEPNWFPVRSAQLQELYPEIYNFDGKTEEEFSKNFEESEKLAKGQYLKDNPEVAEEYNKKDNNTSQLYQNLLKELEYGRGKEVFERIKRDYNVKNSKYEKLEEENDINYIESIDNFEIDKNKYSYEIKEIEEYSGYYPVFIKNGKEIEFEEFKQAYNKNIESLSVRYTLEEQQEEAIVELLGLMTAEKLDAVKDGKLISLLKRLLKEIKAFVRDMLKQREVEIDKLPDNMTLGDLSDLLAYSNSKLILPGNEVVYTTPDNQQFKTYSEASNHISDLAKSVDDVDLSTGIEKYALKGLHWKIDSYDGGESLEPFIHYFNTLNEAEQHKNYLEVDNNFENISIEKINNYLPKEFVEKNKKYEQSKEIIEEWKKVNNIQYNPEEVYSRGQGFYSIAGAFADFEVELMFQNLLAHIEDNKKAGGQFTISATTDVPDHSKSNNALVIKNYGKNIYYKIYPKSEDILWATPKDCGSGSVVDASEKIGSKLGKELTGVSYTKYPLLTAVEDVQPSLAETIDKTDKNRNFYNYNELGINLTHNNFRLEYDEDIPYSTKKIINSINSILDQKYGKVVKPNISEKNSTYKSTKYVIYGTNKGIEKVLYRGDSMAESKSILQDFEDRFSNLRIIKEEVDLPNIGIQPTQTNETLKESIDSVKVKYIGGERKIIDEFGQISYEPFDSEIQKEYTEQALINTKIAKLKEVAKKYPRSLIRSEVMRINDRPQIELFESEELPFQKVSQSGTIKAGREVIPLSERPDLYKAFKLLDSKGEIITYPTKSAGIKRLNGLNKSSELYDFDIRKTDPDEKWIIFPLRPITNLEPVAEEDSPMVDDRELYDTTGDMAKYGGDMFQLSSDKRQDTISSVDNILKSTLANIGISVKEYANLQERLGVDAYGFTKLLAGSSEIGIAELRDKFTLSEESGHIYFEMLRTTPFYDRVLNELEKEDYYKTILNWDGNFQEYYDQYKGNKLALKREAAGKLLGKTIFTKAEEIANQPAGIRLLLARIKGFLKKTIAKFNYNAIKPEIDLLMGEIADNALKGTMNTIGGDVRNISNNNEVLYRIKDNLQGQKELTTKMLESVIKRQQFYRLREDKEQVEKYQDKERKLLKFIDEVKHLEGISFYLDSLKEEQNEFSNNLDISIDVYSKDKPFTPARIRKDSGSLRNMKFIIDANLTTVTAIVDELSAQYRYSKDDTIKEVLKPLLEEAKLIKDNFQEAENIYYDLGTTLVSAFLTPLLGNRNSQDFLDKVNFGKPESQHLKPLNIKDALNLTEGDINMISRWMDALADTDDGILQLIDMAVKNQKIKSDEESLNDQKDLIDAQKKLNKGGINSTEFMAETYNGKTTGYFVTEANWGEFYAERDIFFSDLNKYIKETYDIDSYKEFKQLGDPEDVKIVKSKVAKFYSKYTLSSSPENSYFNKLNARIQRETGFETYMDLKASSPGKALEYAKDISLFFQMQGTKFAETANDVDTLLEEKRNSMSKEEFILWEYFNTREDEYTGEITILKNKNKQYQEIQNNPAKKEYYNTILKMKYDLDMLLPEKKRHPRRMIQIKKDWMERLKDATTSMDKEGLTNIMREIGEAFTIPEDADDRGVKFALSTDASKVVKFLPIYYINKLKNTSELSTDITGTMAVYSTMARDFAAMNEIVDTLEIARDLIDNREILSTDSKGNPIIESLKGSNIKMIRRITKQKGKSLSADRLAGYMDMMLYGELKADEGRLGVMIDTFTKYSALTSLGLNLFAGGANIISGFSQMRHQALSNEYFGEKSTLYADGQYWDSIMNIVSGIGRLDNRSIITDKTAKVNLWRQHMNIQMDRKGDAKSLEAERKTMLGRLFDTSALFFINNIGEHYIQTRTSLALANNYRYDKKLNKFVWREEYFAEVNKLDLKRRQEIKDMLTYKQINELKEKLKDKKLSNEEKSEIKAEIKRLLPSSSEVNKETSKINKKYKALSEELNKDLEASWKDMTNYYEAHENVNNRLKLKEGFKANLEDKQKFIHRTNALNKEFHGIYNDIDKNEAQRYALFRLAWQFRKWMVPYWNRRYGKSMYHAEKGDYQEGFYKVVGRFISQIYAEVKFGEFSLRKNWNMLSQQEKANFYKVMSEVGHILGFMVLAALLTAGADDDEDNWWLQMGAYQANRAVTELGSMSLPWGIQEGLRIVDQPFAGVSHIKNLSTIAAPWDWFDEIERGRYEGYTKFERMLIKGTPGLSQVKDWMYPEEKMVFYTGNK